MIKVRLDKPSAIIQFINTDDSYVVYALELKRCKNAAELMDWIFQINEKDWATPQVVKDMLNCIEKACDEYFGDSAQGVFCPSGQFTKVEFAGY